jgi:NhaP-type Na+/H+ or K+/H+ antiporter
MDIFYIANFPHMETYILSLTLIGFAALSMAWIPELMRKINISYSILYILLGVAIYSLFNSLPWPDPLWQEDFTVHFTELVVIISLMGTGLKIDNPFSFKTWNAPLRLISLTMLLFIGIATALGYWAYGFDIASAVLLGAVLAPTDPVLAADVQVGPPSEGKEDDSVRFTLTAEAGMNDGMAFPFTWLAVVLAISAETGEPWVAEWIGRDVIFRIIVGVLMGVGMGRLLAYLFFELPERLKLPDVRAGFVALSSTLLVYGLTEIVHGYGFIAVFVTAITLRNYERSHEYHKELHHFTHQIERILLAVILVLFGGSLMSGVLDQLTWGMALGGIAFVLLVRPLTGLAGLIGTDLTKKEKTAISFFGIRGVGSFFYLSFALSNASFQFEAEIWTLVAFVVLISIVVHGLTASIAMKKLNLRYAGKRVLEDEQD